MASSRRDNLAPAVHRNEVSLPSRERGAFRSRAEHSSAIRQLTLPATRFIHTEGATGLLMLVAAVAALLWVNLGGQESYEALWQTQIAFQVGDFRLDDDLRTWINDFLLAFFFYAIGLEIKYELVHGDLRTIRTAVVPAFAAIGGMVVPVALYFSVAHEEQYLHGWGVPLATDIAFALAALSLLGKRAPPQLKTLLLTLAVVDDIGAILVIAFFYSASISWIALGIAAGILLVIVGMRAFGIDNVGLYAVAALALWVSVHESGIHATIAGVALGLATRAKERLTASDFLPRASGMHDQIRQALEQGRPDEAEVNLGELESLIRTTESPLEWGARVLHPVSGYLILPLFALANAGILLSLENFTNAAHSPIAWGILLGLVVGKPLGVVSFGALAIITRLGTLPPRVGWTELLVLGLLAGIGFTMAIFIATLAFSDPDQIGAAKVAIFVASVVAPFAGLTVAWLKRQRHPPKQSA